MPSAVYARYSSHRQGEQSIEGQFAEAQVFAASHGLTIVKEYADRAMTGRNDNREQFQQMLKDSAAGIFDSLIVWTRRRELFLRASLKVWRLTTRSNSPRTSGVGREPALQRRRAPEEIDH